MKLQFASVSFLNYIFPVLLLAVLAAIVVLTATQYYGIALSPDSVVYIAASRSISNGTGILIYDGSPLVTHPPLYPIVLSVFNIISGIDAIISARILNAVLFAVIIILGGLLMKKNLGPSSILALLGTSAIVFSRPLFIVSLWAWSELLFISLTLLTFIFAEKYQEKVNLTFLILLSISVALSFLTRYIGIILIIWGVILILFVKHNNLKKKIIHLMIFIILAGVPPALWITRNLIISNTLLSYHPPSNFTLTQNIKLFYSGLIKWFIPDKFISNNFFLLLISLLIVLFLIAGVFLGWQKVKTYFPGLYTFIIFILIYSVALIITSSIIEYDPIDDRLLSPIYIPLIVFVFKIIKVSVDQYKKFIPSFVVKTALIIVLLIWSVFQIYFIMIKSKILMSQGQGYTDAVWRRSETISYLLENNAVRNTQVYTNSPDLLYILSNITSKKVPHRESARPFSYQLSKLKGSWPIENNVRLIWFSSINKDYLLNLKELSQIANLDTSICFKDGIIYHVRRK